MKKLPPAKTLFEKLKYQIAVNSKLKNEIEVLEKSLIKQEKDLKIMHNKNWNKKFNEVSMQYNDLSIKLENALMEKNELEKELSSAKKFNCYFKEQFCIQENKYEKLEWGYNKLHSKTYLRQNNNKSILKRIYLWLTNIQN